MAIKVLALASGVTGLADHRELNGALATSAGNVAVRSGVFPGESVGALSTVSAMVARVAPVKLIINNSISNALGPYVLVSNANVDITFDAGEAGTSRVDRIIARVYDDTNDASGSTTGSIYYLKGQASGLATAMPNNSILLYEMTVPAGASAGGGGINFNNAVDRRSYTVAAGGIIPIASNTDMAAIVSPYEGMTVYRTDIDVLYVYDGANFKARGQASVASSASLSNINNPYDGMMAVTRDTDVVYVYNGSGWITVANKETYDRPLCIVRRTGEQSIPNATLTAITWDLEDVDTHGIHSTSSNTSRVTPNIAGWYRVTFTLQYATNATGRRAAAVRQNGGTVIYGDIKPGSSAGNLGCTVTKTLQFNGSTDYVEGIAYQDSGGSLNTAGSDSKVMEVEFIRP